MPPERVLCLKLESVDLYNRRATQKSGPLPRKKVSLGEAGGAAGMAPNRTRRVDMTGFAGALQRGSRGIDAARLR